MQQPFYTLADHLTSRLHPGESYTCSFAGESTDFVRFNKSRIRQPGSVEQRYLTCDLAMGDRHAAATATLTGDPAEDRSRVEALLERLRAILPHIPDDPHYLVATEVSSSERIGEDRLPPPDHAIAEILRAGEGRDLVGIYASGGVHRGFANSLGQRNWFTTHSFHLDWSFYKEGDKAVKCAYAGFAWDSAAFQRKLDAAAAQLAVLDRAPRTVPPGGYRVYLTPDAMVSLLEIMSWGGFSLKEYRTKQTPLIRIAEGVARFDPSVRLFENTAGGMAPDFQGQGFRKPDRVALIRDGGIGDWLASPRSAREYGVPTNGASDMEVPESLDLAPGTVPTEEVLAHLGTGVWISNLWYMNYSDRPAGRMTGMTRFATFWVENGAIQAPLNVMRFDETIDRLLGRNLVGLTDAAELIPEASTYGGRSTMSARTPGIIVEDFRFTL